MLEAVSETAHRKDAAGAQGKPIVVFHVMRTYEQHGGERQLAQYFAADPAGDVDEHFAFLYADPKCASLFRSKGSRVTPHNLISWPLEPRQDPRLEVFIALAVLPFAAVRLIWLLSRTSARVCVVHGVQAALVAWLAGMVMGRRVRFMYVHRTTKRTGTSAWLRSLYAPYRIMAGISEAARDSLRPLTRSAEYIALPNGVDLDAIDKQAAGTGTQPIQRPHVPMIISVGRLLPSKRQDLLIEAIARIRRRKIETRLWIVGDGPTRAELEKTAQSAGVAEAVTFWGHRSDVPQLLAVSSVFANASTWEGLSNAVLEAMAVELPSVVVDAPGVTECHVNGETGLVVAANADALADALSTLLSDATLRGRLGKAARDRVRREYSAEANRKRFLAVYHRLLEAV
jgi:glycosyltransferase involved in cell wall biosynthesis